MIWLTWRQFRTQIFAALTVLAAAAAYVLITGTQLRHSYTADLASCGAQNDCFGVLNGLQDQYNGPLQLAEMLVLAAPGLIGIFWGAPLVAGELERGTHLLAWNQSVTRTRWLAVKLSCLALASVVTVGVLSLLLTWWASPLDAASGNRFGTMAFNARDVAPLGYAAFAFALGVALGLLFQRTLPAMAVTLAIFIAVQVLVTAGVRPHLLPATAASVPVNQTTMSQAIRFDRSDANTGPVTVDLPAPSGSWLQSESEVLNSSGRPVQTGEILSCWTKYFGQPGASGKGGSPGMGPLGACLASDNLHVDLTYQAADRYWQLQWIETALYGALALLLAVATFRRTRRLRG
ncbi:ABC transporter permease subunit [Actinospica durhamensis]|uniref:ABC transporter permease subunit n=1 Tax=Actinospica durhamensis TaxID=1508375 RepID=A0A941EX81_9ACTN|nr:ABC transporter permease subunit [Actinospica durhamensis]MBR7838906.1 ABC transporter permease subunit [Actinospica durhamensis]